MHFSCMIFPGKEPGLWSALSACGAKNGIDAAHICAPELHYEGRWSGGDTTCEALFIVIIRQGALITFSGHVPARARPSPTTAPVVPTVDKRQTECGSVHFLLSHDATGDPDGTLNTDARRKQERAYACACACACAACGVRRVCVRACVCALGGEQGPGTARSHTDSPEFTEIYRAARSHTVSLLRNHTELPEPHRATWKNSGLKDAPQR
eukprot:gene10514-biopygen4779